MDVRSAQVFVAVAEELSFTRAAQRLDLSAPTVSEAIKRLERELSHVLFDRTPRSVEPTAYAQALLPAASALLEAHRELERETEQLGSREMLSCGLLYGFGDTFVRRLEERLLGTHPVSLTSRVFDWSDPTCGLRARECDLAVLIGPTGIDDRLTRVPLGEQSRMALLPDDESTPAEGTVSLEDVDRLGWIPVAVGDEVWDAAWRLDDLRGGPPHLNGPAQSSIEGMISAVRAGVGCIVTIEVFSELYAPVGVRMLPMRDVPSLPVDLAFRGPATSRRFAPLAAMASLVGAPDSWY